MRFDELVAEAEGPREKARLYAGRRPGAGAWVTALPIAALGLKMGHLEFAASVRLLLGMQMYRINPALPAQCNQCKENVLDSLAHHSLSCSSNNDRSIRHNSVRDVVHEYAVQGGFSSRKEVKHLLARNAEDYGLKPADILIENFENGQPLCIDVTVVNPLRSADSVRREAQQRGAFAPTLEAAEVQKLEKYEDKCRDAGMLFAPLAFEATGGHGRRGRHVLRRLADACAARNNYTRSLAHTRLKQLISIAIQRANANALLRRDPNPNYLPGAH